jgi:tetratricopeptide (TPR) repeat protein
MLELARESGDESALFTALRGVWMDHNIAARYHEADEVSRQMLEVAERGKSPARIADALAVQAWAQFHTGRYGDALTKVNRATALCPDGVGWVTADGSDPISWSLSLEGRIAWVTGYPDRAVNLSESAIKRSRELNQPFSLTQSLFWASVIRFWRGDVVETGQLCEQISALAEEGGFASFAALTRIYQGWIASMQGEHERAIEVISSGLATPIRIMTTHASSVLAEACLRAGRYQEAMDAVAAGREHTQKTGEHFAESEIERIAGDALILMGAENAAEAEQCMRRAIAIAAEQGAKSWELRATMSLARLMMTQGKRDEARAILADIYNWFTEGFDTAGLKHAKSLLDDLGK